ncbi:nucleotidyltransferase family protein [Mesonia aestuariivivens]|uniref:Nucleotidyltransferase domain-containing protein n=1 Tax=Mesonia aestuariivivens TaxID=2796128 RepID=A0ABS6W595_9FLAO|nr:nucleotidyltransferase domain-containing protein [Mesonia aestuariivivens]MBW2963040.1 nucleotidyltransferase domain-containing protein [Mesonia aestuariivivens]
MIDRNIKRVKTLCKKHKVEKLYLFGSATNETFSENSDIDFLVKFNISDLSLYFDNYISFKEKLGKIFKRDIDLVEEQTLKNPILINSINKNKELIYG